MTDTNTKPLILSDRFANALSYAAEVHREQMRKKTSVPYISHLITVSAIVLENGGIEDEAIAALLHDAPEDQGGEARLKDIREKFGDRVAEIVAACSDAMTETPEEKPPWRTRKAAYHRHLREVRDGSIVLVSAADKLHNARATLRDLKRQGNQVWKRFNASPEDTMWNYEQLIEIYEAFARVKNDARVAAVAEELAETIDQMQEFRSRETMASTSTGE